MAKKPKSFSLKSTLIVITPNQSTIPINVSPSFFEDLDKNFDTFQNHLLVSCLSFDCDWPNWEIHPEGDEIVYLLSGKTEILLEKDTKIETLEVSEPGSYIIIPKNTWHRAKTKVPTTMIFITPGQNTKNKPVK